MSTTRPWIAVLLLFASPALASAQLRFAQPTIDLGELRGGPIYQHRFEFVNDSAQSIQITNVRLGCGCLQPKLDKQIFRAGEKGTLLMYVRTLGQPNGARTWQVQVQYNLGDKPHETPLVIGATIRNEVTIEPSIVALTVETTLRQEITIKDQRPTPLKITAVLPSSPAIKVAAQPMAGGVTKVVLTVSRTDLKAARQEETLNIYTDDPNYRQLQVPITLMKANRAEVSATPDKIEVSAAGSHLVRLRAAGDRPVRIESVEADHPALKLTWASGPGNDATLKIGVDAAKLTTSTTQVRVRMLEPRGATISIPLVLRKE